MVFNEIRADWGTVLYDAEGDYHGFVELYNDSDESVDLSGWHLSDDRQTLDKYKIEQCVIPAYGYTVFWTNTQEDALIQPSSERFMGFSISEGETIFLSGPNGQVAGKLNAPSVERGFSYGRRNPMGLWLPCHATPAGPNKPVKFAKPKPPEAPIFSMDSGFYNDSMVLSMAAPEGCTVHYTTDGSQPDADSPVYRGPLLLTDASVQPNRYALREDITLLENFYVPSERVPKIHVIRAAAVDSQGTVSKETHGSYLIDYRDRYGFQDIHIMSITTDPANLFDSRIGLYVLGDTWERSRDDVDYEYKNWRRTAPTNYSLSGRGWRRPVRIELFDPEGKQIADQMAGASIHGNWSKSRNQKSFNFYALPEADGNDVLFPGLFDHDYSSVMLRNGGDGDVYNTKIRDVLNQSLLVNRNVTVQDFVPCQVFINGEYWGMYQLQERIHGSTIAEKFDQDKDNLIVLKKDTAVEGKPEDFQLYQRVLDYAENHDLADPKYYAAMSQMIDIQSFIDYHAFEIYIANCDSISNNYAMWRVRNPVDDQYGDGRWRWILYDTDYSTGLDPKIVNPSVNSFTEGHLRRAPVDDVLFGALIKNTQFKLQFAHTLNEMGRNDFRFDRVDRILTDLTDTCLSAAVMDQRRVYDPEFTEQRYLNRIQVIRDFYRLRYSYLYGHMVEVLDLEEYGF